MRLVRLLVRLTWFAVLLVPVCGALLVPLLFDRHPSVDRAVAFTPDYIERAKRILDSNDPRRLRTGNLRTVAMSASDVDLALNYLAQRYGDGGAEARFEPGALHVRGSLRLPALPWQPYVNVDVRLRQASPVPAVERFRIGRLPLPTWFVSAATRLLLARVWSGDDLALMREAIKDVAFDERGLRLTYQWHRDLVDTVRTALVRPEDAERLRVYQRALAEATRTLPPGPVALSTLLTPLFAVAAERGRSADPIAENRAAILVLTFYVDGRSLSDVIPEAARWPRPTGRGVRLAQRGDFAQHFTISAALSANTGGPFADAVGVYKEVADSRGGSGFSFDDIAADRAGSRLGHLAERQESARRLQLALAAPLQDRDIVPDTRDLPSSMPEAEFIRRFGGVGAPEYTRMIGVIDRRIAALPLLR